MSIHCSINLFFWNEYIIINLSIIRYYKTIILTLLKCSHKLCNLMFNNTKHLAFTSPAAFLFTCYCHFDLIHVKCTITIWLFNKYIIFPAIDCNKTKTSFCAFKYTCNSSIFRLSIFALLRHANSSIFNKLIKNHLKLRSLTLRNIKKNCHLFSLHWNIKFII